MYNYDDGLKSFEIFDNFLLAEDGDSENSLIKEHFVSLENGMWRLTTKGRTYIEAVLLIRKSNLYIKLTPIVCVISIALTIMTLVT
jgi:hypothetical protein